MPARRPWLDLLLCDDCERAGFTFSSTIVSSSGQSAATGSG